MRKLFKHLIWAEVVSEPLLIIILIGALIKIWKY